MTHQHNSKNLSGDQNIDIMMPEWDDKTYNDNLQYENKQLKTTPLHEWHLSQSANMADFGGYHMPLWYKSGVKNEHLAVLNSAGIFDTSHMACITIKGKDAFELLQFCFTRDLTSLKQGRCVYGAFLDEKGYCLDDAIVYKFSNTIFMVCVNSGMGSVISAHLTNNKKDLNLEIMDLTDRIAKMDIQGKNSARILKKVLKNPDEIFNNMPYFSFKVVELLDNTNILLSRSGYTGEFGFEIFISPHGILKLWEDVLKAGEKYNIIACGLASRDSLRTGAGLPLSHQDIGHFKFINHPWDFALPYNNDKTEFTKNFIGKKALMDKNQNHTYPFVGFDLRKIAISDDAKVLDQNQNNIGSILTCVTDMGIGWHENKIVSIASLNHLSDIKLKGLSCGFVMTDKQIETGTKVILQEGKRKIKVMIVKDIRPDRTARKAIKNFTD